MFKFAVFAALVAVAYSAAVDPKSAAILKLESDISPEGAYQWAYDTENGISAKESGVPKPIEKETPVVASGEFAYETPEGEKVQIQYVADENGYQPQGNVIPTPPAIPPAIYRALEWIAAHPQKEK